MDNMKLYNDLRAVPETAKKKIGAGRLKGMTDINPMWRIQRLTEVFGPCGIGWWYEVTDKRIERDEVSKQAACFVDIKLYYVDPTSGTVSNPIFGTGGSSFVAQEKSGAYLSDECFKMALTDAISIAGKHLGLGADVWFEAGRTKYTATEDGMREVPAGKCADCGQEIRSGKKRDGTPWAAENIANYMTIRYGRPLCVECAKKVEANR